MLLLVVLFHACYRIAIIHACILSHTLMLCIELEPPASYSGLLLHDLRIDNIDYIR